MIRIRLFENEVRHLFKEGLIPSRFGLYSGGEAVAAGVCTLLGPEDQIGSTHRPLGHLIAKGCDLKKLMAEICGKATGFNKGKAGPYHAFDPSVGALGANGIVGGSVPMVAGYALANQLKGKGNVSVAFFGEGASNQGGVQETLNLAACWMLPIVFICENSSTEVQVMLGHEIDYPQLSIENVGDRGSGYGMPGSTFNGWDAEEVFVTFNEAVKRARNGGGPSLLEYKINRMSADVEKESAFCPIRILEEKLKRSSVLTDSLAKRIMDKEAEKVKQAVDFAIRSPDPELIDAYSDVFQEGIIDD